MSKKRKKQAVGNETISEIPNNTEATIQKEDNCRIYTYLKNNPGLFAGSGAVIIAILSALISLCSYVYENAYLRYWNIDPVYIKLDTANRIYGSIVSFFFLCILLASFAIIDSIADMYATSADHATYLRQLKKAHWKHVRKEKHKKLISQLRRSPFHEDTNIQYTKKSIYQLEQNTRESRRTIILQVLISLLILCVVLTIAFYFWICVVTPDSINEATQPLPASIASSLIIILPLFLLSTCMASKKRTSKIQATQDYKSLSINTDIPEVSFPIKKLLSNITCFKQPDYKIKRFLACSILFVLFVSLAMTLAFDYFGSSKAETQQQFMIISNADADYAIMYNNGEYAILARCCQSNSANTITIDPSVQQVISIEGMTYTIGNFEEVYRDILPDSCREQEAPTE